MSVTSVLNRRPDQGEQITYIRPLNHRNLILHLRPLKSMINILRQPLPFNRLQIRHQIFMTPISQSPARVLPAEVGDDGEAFGRGGGDGTVVVFEEALTEGLEPGGVDLGAEGVAEGFVGGTKVTSDVR